MATVTINRAPVLTLWAAVVAERLGYDWEGALTLGRALAGMNAASKARTLGLARTPRDRDEPKRAKKPVAGKPVANRAARSIRFLRCGWRARVRALTSGVGGEAESVERYLEGKVRRPPGPRARRDAGARRSVLEVGPRGQRVRPLRDVPAERPRGGQGWGAKGVLDLDVIARLTRGREARDGDEVPHRTLGARCARAPRLREPDPRGASGSCAKAACAKAWCS